MNMNRDEIKFQFQFNLHKLMGLPIDDNDIPRIASIFDCDPVMLAEIDTEFKKQVSLMAAEVRKQFPKEIRMLTDKRRKVICIGDSITSDRKSYQKILTETFSKENRVSFIDAAISGDTTKDLMDRFYSTILNHRFNTAVIFIGTNDSRMLDDGSHLPYTKLSEYEDKVKYIINIIKKRKADIYLITLPYVDIERLRAGFSERNFYYSKEHIDCMNTLIRKIAGETSVGLIDLAKTLQSKENVLEPDGIHINSKAQTILAKMVLSEIAKK